MASYLCELQDRATRLLCRYRGTVRFPVDEYKMYRSLLPESFNPDTVRKTNGSNQQANFNSLFAFGTEVVCALMPKRGFEDVEGALFTLRLPKSVPLPFSSGSHLYIDAGNKDYEAVAVWIRRAGAVEDKLSLAIEDLTYILNWADGGYPNSKNTPLPVDEFTLLWPEVGNLLTPNECALFRVPRVDSYRVKERERSFMARFHWPRALSDRLGGGEVSQVQLVNQMLTGAMLLPDAAPSTWVFYN